MSRVFGTVFYTIILALRGWLENHHFEIEHVTVKPSFPVIHKVDNAAIFVLLKSENRSKLYAVISHVKYISVHHNPFKFV